MKKSILSISFITDTLETDHLKMDQLKQTIQIHLKKPMDHSKTIQKPFKTRPF